MQLLFMVLDQVSENYDIQNVGVTLVIDLRECTLALFDATFLNNMFSVLQVGVSDYKLPLLILFRMGILYIVTRYIYWRRHLGSGLTRMLK